MARVGGVLGAAQMERPSDQPRKHASIGGETAARDSALAGDQSALHELILSCNKQGMEHLKENRRDDALDKFKYAEAMLLACQNDEETLPLLAVTCNNLGCYYKTINKYHGALSYLRRALKMEVELNADGVALAGTHLNISTVLSKLDKHNKAMQHAFCALELMSHRITRSTEIPTGDDYAVLSIAYHRVASEREHFEQWDQAATCFQTGYVAASRLLGESHPLAIALWENCEAVLRKAKEAAKNKRKAFYEGQEDEEVLDDQLTKTILPPIQEAGSRHQSVLSEKALGRELGRSEAAEWMKLASDQWTSFADKMFPTQSAMDEAARRTQEVASPSEDDASMSSDAASMAIAGPYEEYLMIAPRPRAREALVEMQQLHLEMPKAHDMGLFRFAEAPPALSLKQTPIGTALEEHPVKLMDIIDADGDSKTSVRSGASDFRPNRCMKRSSRTSRLVRRSGVFNSTVHRDRVMQNLVIQRKMRSGQFSSLAAQTMAAERIQSVWRYWYRYCQQNSEWMTITWICATMIQSHWRSYHVRRKRLDKYAMVLQRHVRGGLVRTVLKKHTAAVTIQRRVVGMITRRKLQRLHDAAIQMQRITRGGLTRKWYKDLKHWRLAVIIAIQRMLRMWFARRRMGEKRREIFEEKVMLKACVDMQRFFRGWKGRKRVEQVRAELEPQRRMRQAAIQIQLLSRVRKAKKRVNTLREERLREMDNAATFLRKLWVGVKTRRDYEQLKKDYAVGEKHIITIQRYVRGCMCRLRMWRDAVRAEDEIWAASIVQRVWRGYLGRVRWEGAYEEMWRREKSAAKLQPWVRGWTARLRVRKRKKQIARKEFELAAKRFRSSCRIQALVRGVQARAVQSARRARVIRAAVEIQRHARGRGLRRLIWAQVMEQRAILIQTAARRFLVRNRMHNTVAKVLVLQRNFRRLHQLPAMYRSLRTERMVARRSAARVIQRKFREHRLQNDIKRIKGEPERRFTFPTIEGAQAAFASERHAS